MKTQFYCQKCPAQVGMKHEIDCERRDPRRPFVTYADCGAGYIGRDA